ncbi:DUF6542 domain-containing protein [Streptomyces sioyaensis]|uniref:DUF6542 domain-containing protein n=1 Tax=Streptomyces sioyaensis TaxID=67364 RepID=UPI0037CCF2E5
MAGQWAVVPDEGTQPSPAHSASGHGTQRPGDGADAGRRTTGPRHRRKAKGTYGFVSVARRKIPASLLAWVLPVLGAAASELTGSSLGWIFVITAVIGTAWVASRCSRSGAWWVACAIPLLIAAITVAAGQFARTTVSDGGQLASRAVRWAIDGFPAMAAAEATLILVLAVRGLARRRKGKNSA